VRRISQEQKARAQEDVDRSTNLSLVAGFLGAAVGGPVGLVVPPMGVGLGVAFAAWVAALGRHIGVVQRVVRDPPDPDFESVTRTSSVRVNLEALSGDQFAAAHAPALEALLRSSTLGSAMVRGLERSQGAALAGAQDFEEERFGEATQFAGQLAESLQTFGESSTRVIEAVRDLPPIPQVLPQSGRLMDLLSDEVLAELYRIGVPRGDLNVPVMERVNEDPRELFARGLAELTDVALRYAELLVEGPSRTFSGGPGRDGAA
jgi:hypothetical protein